MPDARRGALVARALLTAGALLPYWRLLTFSVVFITDDYFASDIFNGELPARSLIGSLIRQRQMPVWTSQLCSGLPLAGSPADPIGLAVFSLLPAAAALDLYVIVLLLVAAHGSYGLARRFGVDRTSAVLAGLAFAGSGYIACQLKHLGIIATVVWLPMGMLLIDRALDRETRPRGERALFMGAFGLVYAQQVLAGFPQSAYICALLYGAFALFDTTREWRAGSLLARAGRLAGLGVAIVLGAAAGALVLLPLAQLGQVSDRAEALGWSWSTRLAYWPSNVVTFFFPYANGDIANNTYIGPPFFWEDYGYVGLATALLAIYGAVKDRRRSLVMFTIVMTVVAYFFVLGAATPVFRIAYEVIPGLKLFRFPTRFLIVVELGIALLGAVGLTRLRADLSGRWPAPSRLPQFVTVALCAVTAVDLFIHQPRQNPMVPAVAWLAPPASVELIRSSTVAPRTFTPRHRELHRRTFVAAKGWADVQPYFTLRDVLEPNTGAGYWGVPAADCYVGISARWSIDVWGDHNREQALVATLAALDFDAGALLVHPALANVLRTFGVTHVLSPFPQRGSELALAARSGGAYVYQIDRAARTRVVRAARHASTSAATAARLLDPAFDPDDEILLSDAPATIGPIVGDAVPEAGRSSGRAAIVREDSREIVIEADAPAQGFLLLADTFYPGWTASVDGAATPVYRANHSVRGIQLPKGRHEVRFRYEAPGFATGLRVTLIAFCLLLVWILIAAMHLRSAGDRGTYGQSPRRVQPAP